MAAYPSAGAACRRGPSDPNPGERRRCGGGAGAAFSVSCDAPTNAQLQVRDRKIEALRHQRDNEACKRKELLSREWDVDAENFALKKQLQAKDDAYAVLRKEMDQANMVRAQLQTAVQSQQTRIDQQERALSELRNPVADQFAATAAAASAVADRLRSEKAAIRAHAMFAADAAQDGAERLADRELALWEVKRQKECVESQLREALAEVSRLSAACDAAEASAAAARADATRAAGSAALRAQQLQVDSAASRAVEDLKKELEAERSNSQTLRKERDESLEALRQLRSAETAADGVRSALRRDLDVAGARAAESAVEARQAAAAAAALDQEAAQLRQNLDAAQTQVQTLRTEAAQLRRGLEAAETLAARREVEAVGLRGNLDAANARVAALESKAREHRDARDEVDGRAAVLQAQVAKMVEDGRDRDVLAEDKERTLAEMKLVQDELDVVKARLRKAEVDAETQAELRCQLEEDVKRQTDSNAWLRNKGIENESRICALQSELEAQTAKHALQMEKVGAGSVIEDAARLRELEVRAEGLAAEATGKSELIKKLDERKEQLAQEVGEKTAQLQQLQARCAELEAKLEAQSAESVTKDARIKELGELHRTHAEDAEAKGQKVSQLWKRISDLEAQAKSHEEDAARKTTMLQELETKSSGEALDAAKQADRLRELEAQIVELMAQAELNANELSTKAGCLQQLQAEFEETEEKARSATQAAESNEARLSELEAQLVEHMAEAELRSTQLAAKTDRVTELETDMKMREDSLRAELTRLREELDRAQSKSRELETRVGVYANESAGAAARCLELEATVEETHRVAAANLQAERERAAGDLRMLREEFTRAKAADDDAAAAALQEAKDRCAALSAELEAVKQELSDTTVDAQNKIEFAERALTEEKERAAAELAHAKEALDKLKDDKEWMDSERQVVMVEYEEFKTETKAKEEKSVKNAQADREKWSAKVARMAEELEKVNADAKKVQELSDREKKLLLQEKADLEKRMMEVQRELETMREAQTAAAVRQQREQIEEEESERLRAQCQELSYTLQQLKQENEALFVESGHLREKVALFEGDLLKASDANAKLVGHNNPSQKIRYCMKLKDEKNQMRAEVDKLRSRIHQLETSRRRETLASTLFDAFVSLDLVNKGKEPTTPGRPGIMGSPTLMKTPTRKVGELTPGTSRTPKRSIRITTPGEEQELAGGLRLRPEEAIRRCHMQERQLERISTDFGHLAVLVERAVMKGSSETPTADTSKGFAGLLQRLREISGAAATALSVSAAALASSAASSETCLAQRSAGSAAVVAAPASEVKKGVAAITGPTAAVRRTSRAGTGSASCEVSDSDEDLVNNGPREATDDLCQLLMPKPASASL